MHVSFSSSQTFFKFNYKYKKNNITYVYLNKFIVKIYLMLNLMIYIFLYKFCQTLKV
jgi:hypothetical protein